MKKEVFSIGYVSEGNESEIWPYYEDRLPLEIDKSKNTNYPFWQLSNKSITEAKRFVGNHSTEAGQRLAFAVLVGIYPVIKFGLLDKTTVFYIQRDKKHYCPLKSFFGAIGGLIQLTANSTIKH